MNSRVYRAFLFAAAGLALVCARAADVPAPLPANAPWEIHQTAPAAYPMRLMREGVTHGLARVRVSLAADGQLLDALLVACTHREFGDEALRVVKRWRYTAERAHGEYVGIVGDITFLFQVNGTVAVEKKSPVAGEAAGEVNEPLAYRAESPKRIDRIPTPLKIVPPVFPPEWSEHGIAGSATVVFYIDETGRVRIPLVTVADHPQLAASAVAAVTQWQFEPPTRGGKPVLVQAENTFAFPGAKK